MTKTEAQAFLSMRPFPWAFNNWDVYLALCAFFEIKPFSSSENWKPHRDALLERYKHGKAVPA